MEVVISYLIIIICTMLKSSSHTCMLYCYIISNKYLNVYSFLANLLGNKQNYLTLLFVVIIVNKIPMSICSLGSILTLCAQYMK